MSSKIVFFARGYLENTTFSVSRVAPPLFSGHRVFLRLRYAWDNGNVVTSLPEVLIVARACCGTMTPLLRKAEGRYCYEPNQGDLEVSKLIIIANIRANPDHIELVKGELEKLIPITRAEEGCIQYDLHQNNENPAHFLFFEKWESRDLWQIHINAPHLAAYLNATEGAVAEFTVYEMCHIA